MSISKYNRSIKLMIWAGRILVSIATILFMWALTDSVLLRGNTSTVEVAAYILLSFIVLAGFFLSWWKDRIVGALLIFISLGFIVMVDYISYSFNAWLIIGLPYLVSGILFIAVWILSDTPLKSGSHSLK